MQTGKAKLVSATGKLASVVPLLTVVGLNWSRYITSSDKKWALATGGILVAIILAIKLFANVSKSMGGGYTALLIAFGVVYLLEPIVLELKMLIGMCVIGESVNKFIFQPIAKKIDKPTMAVAGGGSNG